jgi:hypothetical protein
MPTSLATKATFMRSIKPLLLSAEEDKTQVVSAGRSDGAPGVSGARRYVATFILYAFALQTQR